MRFNGADMGELADKVRAMDGVLAGQTSFDRALMDRAFATLKGLNLDRINPKIGRKLDRVLIEFNRLAAIYPDASDPTKPLPATALVAYAYHMQEIRNLARLEVSGTG